MSSTTPKPFVFVLMPFRSEFDDLYKLGIAEACKEAGTHCERVDEQIFTENIVERIYNQIAKADLIVAVMTGKNPNVFYETGYAHALGQRTILLTEKADDIPFDVNQFPHVIYGNSISNLKDELKKRIRWLIQNPEKRAPANTNDIKFYMYGMEIIDNTNITMKSQPVVFTAEGASLTPTWHFSVDIHNSSDKLIDMSNYDFGIIFKLHEVLPMHSSEAIHLPGDEVMVKASQSHTRLLPLTWRSEKFAVCFPYQAAHQALYPITCRLVVYSELGKREVPFSVLLRYQD